MLPQYAGYYDELLVEMANAAGELWCDIDRIKRDIYNHEIPWKARRFAEEDDETETAAFWFNTVALTLTETDISTLFYRESNFEDEESEKEKRLRI